MRKLDQMDRIYCLTKSENSDFKDFSNHGGELDQT